MKMIQQYSSKFVKQLNFRYNLFWLYVGLFSVLILFSDGCKKDKLLGEYLLGDLKNQNPFNGTETIIFLDNNNDSIVFYGDGRSSYLIETESTLNRRYHYINERDECVFTEKNGDFKFSIFLTSRYETFALMDVEFTQIDKENNGECSMFNSGGYLLPLFENYKNTKLFMDSLNVLDKYYYNIIADSSLLTHVSGICNEWNKVSCIFYTTSSGIIKIDFEDGLVWELKEIIP